MYWSRVLETQCGLVEFGLPLFDKSGRRELIRIVNPSVITTMSQPSFKLTQAHTPLQFIDNEALMMFLQSNHENFT